MPRYRKRSSSVKRQTKWCAAVQSGGVANVTSLVAGDATNLCPGTTADQDQPDPVVGWCRGSISISRINTSTVNPTVAWAIVLMRTAPGSPTAVQTFSPYLGDDLERQDILGMGYCEVPPVAINSADNAVVDRSSKVTSINIKVSRKLHRNTNGLFFWIVAEGAGDNQYHVEASIRTLMKFA